MFDPKGTFKRVIRHEDLKSPRHLTVDSEDNILVCDRETNEVLVFSGRTGGLVGRLKGVNEPNGVTIDGEGRILVTESGGHKISIF